MSSTVFTSGTIISSSWLNDVNNAVYNSGSFSTVTSIANLRAVLSATTSRVIVLGYYTAGDGGGGEYYYDPTDSSSTDNGGTIIVATDNARWKLIVQASVNVKQFGAKGDGVSDDTPYFTAALNSGYPAYAPPGSFMANIVITSGSGKKLIGAGKYLTTIQNYGNSPIITLNSTSASIVGFTLEGVWLQNRNTVTYPNADGIYITGDSGGVNQNDFHTFRDLYVFQMRYGFIADQRSIWNTFERVVFATSLVHGMYIPTTQNCDQWSFRQVRFANSAQYGLYINHQFSTLLDSWCFETCDFENNGYNGVRITGTFGIQGMKFITCHFENNCTQVTTGTTSPRKSNIFVDSTYCFGLSIEECTLYNNAGGSGGNPDWNIYVSSANCRGAIKGCRFAVSTNGDVNWQLGVTLHPDNTYAGATSYDRTQGSINLGEPESEISWTPGFSFGGGATGTTYSVQVGRYVVNGRICYFEGSVTLSNVGSSTGVVAITGLPFTHLNISGLIGTVVVSGTALASGVTTQIVGQIQPNTTVVNLYKYSAGTLTALQNTDITSSTNINVSGTLFF
jgi:hypothetical protein